MNVPLSIEIKMSLVWQQLRAKERAWRGLDPGKLELEVINIKNEIKLQGEKIWEKHCYRTLRNIKKT